MFNFGYGYGLWMGMLYLRFFAQPELEHRIVTVSPLRWKRYFGLLGCDKAASIRKARQRFGIKGELNEGCAEALLLALYAKDMT